MMMGEYLCLLAYGWKTWRTSENPIESPDSRKAKQGKCNRISFYYKLEKVLLERAVAS